MAKKRKKTDNPIQAEITAHEAEQERLDEQERSELFLELQRRTIARMDAGETDPDLARFQAEQELASERGITPETLRGHLPFESTGAPLSEAERQETLRKINARGESRRPEQEPIETSEDLPRRADYPPPPVNRFAPNYGNQIAQAISTANENRLAAVTSAPTRRIPNRAKARSVLMPIDRILGGARQGEQLAPQQPSAIGRGARNVGTIRPMGEQHERPYRIPPQPRAITREHPIPSAPQASVPIAIAPQLNIPLAGNRTQRMDDFLQRVKTPMHPRNGPLRGIPASYVRPHDETAKRYAPLIQAPPPPANIAKQYAATQPHPRVYGHASAALGPLRTLPIISAKARTARPHALATIPPAQNATPTQQIPIIQQNAPQQPQIPQVLQTQQARFQPTIVTGVPSSILLFAGLSLVAVNAVNQIFGAGSTTGTTFADFLLGKTALAQAGGIISKLPINMFGTILAETALVLFLTLIIAKISSFFNYTVTGIIALFWLAWLVENGAKLATIWQGFVTGFLAFGQKFGTSPLEPQNPNHGGSEPKGSTH